jgi:hypothetical protein
VLGPGAIADAEGGPDLRKVNYTLDAHAQALSVKGRRDGRDLAWEARSSRWPLPAFGPDLGYSTANTPSADVLLERTFAPDRCPTSAGIGDGDGPEHALRSTIANGMAWNAGSHSPAVAESRPL